MNRYHWVVLAGFFSAQASQAQYSYRHYGIHDGLAQGSSSFMLNDSRRFLWFNVQGGLNRFDGSTFVFYANGKRGLHGGFVSGLVEDPAGDLWLGTEAGLNRYTRRTDRFTLFRSAHLSKQPVPTHVVDAYGPLVYFLNDTDGLCRLDTRTNRQQVLVRGLVTNKNLENRYVVHHRSLADIWMILPQGLLRYNHRTGQRRYYFTARPDDQIGSPHTFTAIYLDTLGQQLWLADGQGLLAFNPGSKRLLAYASPSPVNFGATPAYGIQEDAFGQLWINTGGAGIVVFDKKRRAFTDHLHHLPYTTESLAIDEIGAVHIDDEQTIWVNTDPLGIDRLVADQRGIWQYDANPLAPQSLASQAVRGVAEGADGSIWAGSVGQGISRLYPKTGQVKRYLPDGKPGTLPGGGINGFCVDKTGRVWVATRQGLGRYVPETDRFIMHLIPGQRDPQVQQIRAIWEEPDGNLLVVTLVGLFRYQPHLNRFTPVGIVNGSRLTGTVWYDADRDYFYVGRWLAGFDAYAYRQGRLQWLFHDPLDGENALCFYQEKTPGHPRRPVWIGCKDLLCYDPDRRRVVHRVALGEGIRPVYSILPDSANTWWLATNRGLYQYKPKTDSLHPFLPVKLQEYNSLASLKTRSGQLYFGGSEGLVVLDPGQFRPHRAQASVAITALLVNDKPYAGGELSANELQAVRLSPDQQNLTFQFTAIDYVSEGKNRFRYRLVGYDAHWIDAGSAPSVRYANLPPGHYVFQLLTAPVGGHWSARPRQLVIDLAAPYWHSVWFAVLAGLAVSGLLYGLFRLLLGQRLRSQRERYKLALASQQQERTRLARELHDHIGPELALLKLRLDVAATDAILPSVQQQLLGFGHELHRVLTDIRNVSHALLPAHLQQHTLVDSLDQYIQQVVALPGQPEISFVHDLPSGISKDVQISVYQLVKELVHNALKHAEATLIDVELLCENGVVLVTVADNGQGYDPVLVGQQTTGIGLRNVQATVTTLHGELTITSRQPQGTVHRIRLPVF